MAPVTLDSRSAGSEELTKSGNSTKGSRIAYSSASLERAGSFQQGKRQRGVSFGPNTTPRGNVGPIKDTPPLLRCLILDPIKTGDQYGSRSSDLMRILGFTSENMAEDNALSTSYQRYSRAVDIEKLKQFKASLLNNKLMARARAIKLNECLKNLSRMKEKKNKHIRTSTGETWVESWNEPLLMANDTEVSKDGSDILQLGGESRDKKMRRKRSAAFRSPTFNGCNGLNRLDSSNLPATSNIDVKKELDKISLPRGFSMGPNEDQVAGNGQNKYSSSVASNNRKRPMSVGSSGTLTVQCVGQRTQKRLCNMRASLVFPDPIHEELQVPSERCLGSDINGKIGVDGACSLLPAERMTRGTQKKRSKQESSPLLSENEDYGARKNQKSPLKDKGLSNCETEERTPNGSQNARSPVLPPKNKCHGTIGDDARRQGGTVRGLSFSRSSVPLMTENFDDAVFTKPLKSARTKSRKSGSKSGRPPLKKLLEKSTLSCPRLTPDQTPEVTGVFEDDDKELLSAADIACNASYNAGSSSFWKMMEPIFAPPSLEDMAFLKQQLQPLEKLHERSFKLCDGSGGIMENGGITNRANSARLKVATPLYQRILSALILDDECEEVEGESDGTNNKNSTTCISACINSPDMSTLTPNLLENGIAQRFPRNNINGSSPLQTGGSVTPSPADEYEKLCLDDKLLLELQTIGIHMEAVPDLEDAEDEQLEPDITEAQERLQEKVSRKKEQLNKMRKPAEEVKEAEERTLEQAAMDKLVEMAYRKQLASRGSRASKGRVSKFPKPVATAFMKRTLSRCQIYEKTGRSCFSEPTLRDVLLAVPDWRKDSETGRERNDSDSDRNSSLYPSDAAGHQSGLQFANTGATTTKGKQKEVLLDHVSCSSSVRTTPTLVKGRRSDREKGKDASVRNPTANSARMSPVDVNRERHPVTKPEQETAKLTDTKSSNLEQQAASGSDFRKGAELNDLLGSSKDPLEDLDMQGFANDMLRDGFWGDMQDCDDDHLANGLDIPMDDLSEVVAINTL